MQVDVEIGLDSSRVAVAEAKLGIKVSGDAALEEL